MEHASDENLKLREIVESSDTRAGRAFDLAVQALVLISVISFSLETLPDLSQSARFWLGWIERITVALFTLEYGLRIAVAERRLGFVFSFFGLVDLIAILPFYLSLGLDLRSVRALRFLRIFRILKLARYSAAIARFHRAFLIAREELALFAVAAFVLVYLAAVGVYYFERTAQPEVFASIFHSLWWAIVTLTTVGYGDAYPVTAGGQIFTGLILVLGLGVVAVPTGLVASALAKARALEDAEPPSV